MSRPRWSRTGPDGLRRLTLVVGGASVELGHVWRLNALRSAWRAGAATGETMGEYEAMRAVRKALREAEKPPVFDAVAAFDELREAVDGAFDGVDVEAYMRELRED